mmetsp:Transcript_44895/g.81930  ORF Transcript_44895/g.81930 Transcript_44895/m.81930 type:complete len:555 (-) Transcript_44895:148-1812(-)
MVGVYCTHREQALLASLARLVAPLLALLCLQGAFADSSAAQTQILEGSSVCTASEAGCVAPATSDEPLVAASVGSSLLQASKVVRDAHVPDHGSHMLFAHRLNETHESASDLQPYMIDMCTPESAHLREFTSLTNAPACEGRLLEERSFLSNTEWLKTSQAIGGDTGAFNNGYAANVSWIHMSPAGETCLLREAPSASSMKTSSQIVIDETVLPFDSAPSSPYCAIVYGDGGATRKLTEHYTKLKAQNLANVEAFRFSYTFRNQTYHDGSLRMVWYKPSVSCQPDGCQVMIYLHGLNRISQLGKWDYTKELNGVERLALRPACEEDYASLRSIVLGPQFEPQAFPQAGPKLTTTHTEDEFANFQLRAQTKFHYHTQELDIFGDAIVPVLKEWTSQHRRDVNMDRIHLVGFSMGAVGAMVGAFNNMDFFASVVAISPCINADTDFPEPVVAWMPHMTAELAAKKKLNRIMMFIGEDDRMYESTGPNCVDVWSQLLGLAQERGLINAQEEDHIEMRFLKDPVPKADPEELGGREHCSTFQYSLLELDAPLWQDRYC